MLADRRLQYSLYMALTTINLGAIAGIQKSLDMPILKATKIPGSKEGLFPSSDYLRNITSNDIWSILYSIPDGAEVDLELVASTEYEGEARDVLRIMSLPFRSFTLMTLDREASTLNVLMRSATRRTLLVLVASPENVLETFITMKFERISCHLVNWLVIMEGEMAGEVVLSLEDLVPEGTLVRVLIKDSEGPYRMFLPRVDSRGTVRFDGANSWNEMKYIDRHKLRFIEIPKKYELSGRVMTVAAKEAWPSFSFGKSHPDGSVEATGGVDVTILKALSSTLNFTYRVVPPPDNAWGNPQPDGTVTGIVGMVVRREADFAISYTSITAIRESVADFTCPYDHTGLRLFSRALKEKNKALAILSSFSYQVWLLLIGTVLIMGHLSHLLSRLTGTYQELDEGGGHSIPWHSFNMFRNIVLQGNRMPAKSWPKRFLFCFWYLFSLIISALYSGMLTAVLAVPAYETPIDSLRDLPEAIKNGFTLGVLGDTTNEYVFKNAKGGIMKQTWGLFNHKDRSQSFVSDPETGMRRVLERKYIFILADAFGIILTRKLGQKNFYLGKEEFIQLKGGILCQTGSPFTEIFSRKLLRLLEGGLVVKWQDIEYSKVRQEEQTIAERKTFAFSLSHLQAAFYLVGMGFSLAMATLITETIIGFKCSSK